MPMTPDEAISRAIDLVGTRAQAAQIWVSIAAELRAQQSTPALDRLLGQVRNRLPAEDPTSRLTLHDIDAGTCKAHARIVIKRSGSSAWWMHPDDKTSCPKG